MGLELTNTEGQYQWGKRSRHQNRVSMLKTQQKMTRIGQPKLCIPLQI